MGPLAFTFFVATAITTAVWCIFRWGKPRQDPPLPPGPFSLPLLGNLPFLDSDLHRCFAKLSRTYGPVMTIRLGCRLSVVLSSPSAVREALKDNGITFANHDAPASALAAVGAGEDILWAPYGPLWRTLRRVSVHTLLSPASVESVSPLRRGEVRRMVAAVNAKAGSPVEIRELVFLTTLNVMARMIWGGTVDDDGVGKEFKLVMEGIVELLMKPNISDFYPLLAFLDIQRLGKRMVSLTDWYYRIFDTIVEERRRTTTANGAAAHNDFLQVMLEVLDTGGDSKENLTMDQLKTLFMELIGGGTDTTSTTVEWAMAELLSNPKTMERTREELKAVVGENRAVEETDIPRLHYLDAVVKEVLRLHPPLPLLVPHSPSSSCTVGGFTVPKGAKVFVNVWAIHREPSAWEDPSSFKPERFLGGDGIVKYDYSGNNFNYLPFGSGRRICPGIPLGEKMVMYILASLLHSFEWRMPENTRLDLTEKFGIVLKKAQPLVAIPSARLEQPGLYSST
ncbi:putative cytochrome P450 76M5-like [Iris pallida]|uniref:Cytochrome P450 76M5-like n=1 Tax=Iris pallida TaxID=29817 RepID=A0AAX6H069_IRIPA|nr:putative cytochrome P450 76M5-like [Iris pallida]